jgi:hypothetical protein
MLLIRELFLVLFQACCAHLAHLGGLCLVCQALLQLQTPDAVRERLLESIQAMQRSGSDMLQLARGVLALGGSLQLAALVRWLN